MNKEGAGAFMINVSDTSYNKENSALKDTIFI